MDLRKYTDRLRDDLVAAAALGDEETRRTAAALAAAIEPSARLLLLSALSDFAAAISAELDSEQVSVRLDGTDIAVDVRRDPAGAKAPHDAKDAPYSSFEDVTGDISRVSLRLMEQIKAKAEEAASQNGVSLNSWVSQAVQGALREQMRRNGMDGF